MNATKRLTSTALAALVVTLCGSISFPSSADAANPAGRALPDSSSKVALLALEKRANEAWKSKDAKFWDTFLWDKFVGWGPSGKLNKASATKLYTGADCDIRSVTLSDEQVQPLGNNAALVTHQTAVDGTCNGKTVPAVNWAASVYVRDGGKWKAAFHAQAAVVDPKSLAAKPADDKAMPTNGEATATGNQSTAANPLLASEKAVWEAWRQHDGKKIGELTASEISFINIFGTHLANKADALKDWSGAYCEVKSISITDASATMLSPTVGILTHKAAADGTCYGQKVGPIWGSSIYVKDGAVWKWTFGINLPAAS